MGLYDEFGEKYIQIKSGECCMAHYKIGDKAPFADGVHLAYEGIVVVYQGVFIAEFEVYQLYNKWGGKLSYDIDSDNPLALVAKELMKKEEDNENSPASNPGDGRV
ncbi:hypothetical protein LCGC14_0346290 [marine sediment metagenome]|uniref:Uncharacterized protein n=1 Tax=marine sediment metagenome TaxID=412755 RepID=A0A0F9TV82_9ZZZZ